MLASLIIGSMCVWHHCIAWPRPLNGLTSSNSRRGRGNMLLQNSVQKQASEDKAFILRLNTNIKLCPKPSESRHHDVLVDVKNKYTSKSHIWLSFQINHCQNHNNHSNNNLNSPFYSIFDIFPKTESLSF